MIKIEATFANKNVLIDDILNFKEGDIVALENNSYLKVNDEIVLKDLYNKIYVLDNDKIGLDLTKEIVNELKSVKKIPINDIELQYNKEINKLEIDKLNNYTSLDIANVIEKNHILFSSIILKYINKELAKDIKTHLSNETIEKIEDIINKSNKSNIKYVNKIINFFVFEIEKEINKKSNFTLN